MRSTPTPARTRRPLIAATCVALLLFAGCGGSDDEASDSTTTAVAGSEAPAGGEGSDTTEANTTVAPDTAPTPTDAPDDEGGEPNDDAAEFCATFDDINSFFETAPNETLEDVRTGAVEFSALLATAAEQAPEELKDDIQEVADYFIAIEEATADATTLEEYQELGEAVSPGNSQAAGNAVDAYAQENC